MEVDGVNDRKNFIVVVLIVICAFILMIIVVCLLRLCLKPRKKITIEARTTIIDEGKKHEIRKCNS